MSKGNNIILLRFQILFSLFFSCICFGRMVTKKKKPLKFVRSVTRIFIITVREGRSRVAYQNILKRHVYIIMVPLPTTKKNIYVKPVAHNIIIMYSRTHSRTLIIVIIVVAIFCTMMTFPYITAAMYIWGNIRKCVLRTSFRTTSFEISGQIIWILVM